MGVLILADIKRLISQPLEKLRIQLEGSLADVDYRSGYPVIFKQTSGEYLPKDYQVLMQSEISSRECQDVG